MKGLIIKDFINLKKNFKIFGIIAILYTALAFASEDANFFSAIFTILFAILTLSLYSYDDMAKWESFALTMPITRENIVQGKYLMMILLTLFGALFGILFSTVMYMTGSMDTPMLAIKNCGVVSALAILFYCIILPFVTKIGVEKARLILFAVYFIPFMIGVLVFKAFNDKKIVIPEVLQNIFDISVKYAYVILPLIVIIGLSISYALSVRIYRRKEF